MADLPPQWTHQFLTAASHLVQMGVDPDKCGLVSGLAKLPGPSKQRWRVVVTVEPNGPDELCPWVAVCLEDRDRVIMGRMRRCRIVTIVGEYMTFTDSDDYVMAAGSIDYVLVPSNHHVPEAPLRLISCTEHLPPHPFSTKSMVSTCGMVSLSDGHGCTVQTRMGCDRLEL